MAPVEIVASRNGATREGVGLCPALGLLHRGGREQDEHGEHVYAKHVQTGNCSLDSVYGYLDVHRGKRVDMWRLCVELYTHHI